MVVMGPGIAKNTSNAFLGTNVDVAPTILGLAGVEAPDMDGKSIVPLVVNSAVHEVPASVRRHLSAAGGPPTRDASYALYYNQGPWEVGTRWVMSALLLGCCAARAD